MTTLTSPLPLISGKLTQRVLQELSTLKTNKASGLDRISAKLLRDSADVPCLTKIFKLPYAVGVFPNIWKKGRVTPIHKSGNPNSCTNYWPPNTILPTLSKLLERIIHHQVWNYQHEHKLLVSQNLVSAPNYRLPLQCQILLSRYWITSITERYMALLQSIQLTRSTIPAF